jgi:hypothetical protein
MIPASQDVSQLLVDWSNGDQAALDKLLPLVNAELRQHGRWLITSGPEQKLSLFPVAGGEPPLHRGRYPSCSS